MSKRFSINVENNDYETLRALNRLRDYINDGCNLQIVGGDDCADGSSVVCIGVLPEHGDINDYTLVGENL